MRDSSVKGNAQGQPWCCVRRMFHLDQLEVRRPNIFLNSSLVCQVYSKRDIEPLFYTSMLSKLLPEVVCITYSLLRAGGLEFSPVQLMVYTQSG